MSDLTVIYYTSNYLESTNPYFLANTKQYLWKAMGDAEMVTISQKPTRHPGLNICVGDIGRSNRNIYWQILQGALAAETRYVATAEDDVLYTADHYRLRPPDDCTLLYNLNKWSVFTWTKPAVFSWRDRMIILGLICNRELLIECLTERLNKYPNYDNQFCGEPGRYESALHITPRHAIKGYSDDPIVVFSHPHALGYISTPYGRTRPVGERKAHGPVLAENLEPWGSAADVMRLWDVDYHE